MQFDCSLSTGSRRVRSRLDAHFDTGWLRVRCPLVAHWWHSGGMSVSSSMQVASRSAPAARAHRVNEQGKAQGGRSRYTSKVSREASLRKEGSGRLPRSRYFYLLIVVYLLTDSRSKREVE